MKKLFGRSLEKEAKDFEHILEERDNMEEDAKSSVFGA